MRNIGFASLIALAIAAPASANIVANGGFESGGFDGWTQFGDTENNSVFAGSPLGGESGPTYEGGNAAAFGPVGTTGGIYQSVVTTLGGNYTLSFALKNDQGASGGEGGIFFPGEGGEGGGEGFPFGPNANYFSVSFDGTVLEELVNADRTNGYLIHSFSLTGTGGGGDLRFTFRQDPSFWELDAVSLTEEETLPAEVPEPAMLGLFGLGALTLGLSRRRRA